MLISSDSGILEEEYNIDDPTENVVIPTIIITKEFGDIIREFNKEKENSNEYIVISMKFSGVKDGNLIELELFYRSDDIKALNFFTEFKYYKEKLGEKLKFIPVFKYSVFVNENYDNAISDKSPYPCVKEGKFCSTPNRGLQIENGRRVLMENIRETCIYQEYGQNVFWNYMIMFNGLCADINNPKFNEECAWAAFNSTGLQSNDAFIVKKCMEDVILHESKIEKDFYTFARKKIYSIPDLHINGVPYRGSWYSKYIFRSMCNGFLDDSKICEGINPRKVISTQRFSNGLLFFIIFITILVTSCSLLCYKRYINRNLEETLNEKIQEQAMKTISQYKVFNDTKNSNQKLELVNE